MRKRRQRRRIRQQQQVVELMLDSGLTVVVNSAVPGTIYSRSRV